MPSVLAKRAIKRAAGLASVAMVPMTPRQTQASACVLMYHRLSRQVTFDPWLDDWNVSPGAFEQHVAALVEHADVVFLREMWDRVSSGRRSIRPVVCLTFDDGYRNFYEEALPILQRYNCKATMFVVTGYIGSEGPMPFDRWGTRHQRDVGQPAWQALGWRDIEACARTGLVEFGGHSHLHGNGASGDTDVCAEAEQSRAVLRARLGDAHASCYAYPYGSRRLGQVTNEYVDAVKRSGYTLAVSTNLGLVGPDSPRYELPRIEVSQSDGPAVIRAKVAGSLTPYSFTERLRQARR